MTDNNATPHFNKLSVELYKAYDPTKRLTIQSVREFMDGSGIVGDKLVDYLESAIEEGLSDIIKSDSKNMTLIECNNPFALGAISVTSYLAKELYEKIHPGEDYDKKFKQARSSRHLVSSLPTCVYDDVIYYWDVQFDTL